MTTTEATVSAALLHRLDQLCRATESLLFFAEAAERTLAAPDISAVMRAGDAVTRCVEVLTDQLLLIEADALSAAPAAAEQQEVSHG